MILRMNNKIQYYVFVRVNTILFISLQFCLQFLTNLLIRVKFVIMEIVDVILSEETEEKLNRKHNVTYNEIIEVFRNNPKFLFEQAIILMNISIVFGDKQLEGDI